jgi:SAM-dependent methyltransferase
MMPNNDCIIQGLLLTANCACIIYLFRTHKVLKERKKILKTIGELCLYDVMHDKEYKWRFEEYESISYSNMLFPFWIDVETFFKDKKCIQRGNEIE